MTHVLEGSFRQKDVVRVLFRGEKSADCHYSADYFADTRARSPRRDNRREHRDSGYGHSGSHRSRARSPPPRVLGSHEDPRKESIQAVWNDSRPFKPTLTEEAHKLLKAAFDLSAVPP